MEADGDMGDVFHDQGSLDRGGKIGGGDGQGHGGCDGQLDRVCDGQVDGGYDGRVDKGYDDQDGQSMMAVCSAGRMQS